MHMADALLSPTVGGTMWAVTAATLAYSAKKVRAEADDSKIPLMGVVGAFVFAAQMINFTIPGTGSSGHLGGGLLLAILLGPYAAFLVMASVLGVQALFFADGGLLALGANIFNLGAVSCFLAYPLIYKPIAGDHPTRGRLVAGALIAGIVALQAGAFGVVLETTLSGISDLPFRSFVLLMQPIHLAIGVVEGMVTAAVVTFAAQADPALLAPAAHAVSSVRRFPSKKILAGFGVAALLTAGSLSWFASTHPDGLEWSIAKVTGAEEVKGDEDPFHAALSLLQQKTAFLPDYAPPAPVQEEPTDSLQAKEGTWPGVNGGTSLAGLTGGMLTLLCAFGLGWLVRKKSPPQATGK